MAPAEPSRAASTNLTARTLRLSADSSTQLVLDVLSAGGELWVSGAGVSMYPTVRSSDLVLLTALRRPARKGDVVLFSLGGRLILHRVLKAERGNILTVGDSCTVADPPVPPERLLGRSIAVRRKGVVSAMAPTLRFGILPLVRFATNEVRRRAVRVYRRLRRRTKDRAAP